MRQVTIDELRQMASDARESIWEQAGAYDREPKIYLHWTAGHYGQCYLNDYHVAIDYDGKIYVDSPLDEVLAHTWRRNSGAVGISLCCCAGATTGDLGDEPPTSQQIEAMAQAIAAIADGLWLTIDRDHVMTHGEAADSVDGIYTWDESDCYGPQHTVERWDLQFLGTDESPYYTADHDDPSAGGNVLRGKALWYKNQKAA